MMPTRLSFVTYNLWHTARWPQREPALRRFFLTFRPDVFCLQELRAQTRAVLDETLPGYRRVKDSFPGWEKESNIYWNAGLLEVVEYGVEDIGIDSDQYRGMFWARLRVLETGQTFFIGTAHFTHQEHADELRTGLSPRLRQAQLTAQALQRMVRRDEPGFFMGDLNDPIVPPLLLKKAGYWNCFDRLGMLPPPTWPAFPTARMADWESVTNQTIDWVTANEHARPIAAGVPQFYYEDFSPSDHWPVQAIYELL